MRVVSRILQVHKGMQRETGRPAAGQGRREEMECPDEFVADYEPAGVPEYGESVPIDRRPTLRVVELLGMGRPPEWSWDEVPGGGSVRPALSERN